MMRRRHQACFPRNVYHNNFHRIRHFPHKQKKNYPPLRNPPGLFWIITIVTAHSPDVFLSLDKIHATAVVTKPQEYSL